MNKKTIILELTDDEAYMLWCWWASHDDGLRTDENIHRELIVRILNDCKAQGLTIKSDAYYWLDSN